MKKIFITSVVTFYFVCSVSAQAFHTNIGGSFPEFRMEDIEGNLVSNEHLKGKPSLIIFFGTRCPPCLKELNELNQNLPKSYYEKFNIYAVGSTDDKESLITFNKKKKYLFSYLPDPNQALFNKVGDHTIPRTFLLDSNAKIITQTMGFYKTPFENLLKNMRKLVE